MQNRKSLKEQKESRPADDLIILVAQQLQHVNVSDTNRIRAIYFLEDAMRHSPYNPNIRIAAILAYANFNAASRCWDLYNSLHIKHIQHESCSYLILKILRSGGLYAETRQVCQHILGLQRNSAREAAEFTGRAMEAGSVSKAEEFITFQREKMQKSLVALEAKGLVLDCAPLCVNKESSTISVGALHGIVGGDSDVQRVKQIISEAHNPSSAFSLLQLSGTVKENLLKFTDNRDFSILSFEILRRTLFDTPEEILSDSIRRCWHHNLLNRAALCIDASKGPKKGKIIKSSSELEKRCSSLVRCLVSFDSDRHGLTDSPGYRSLLDSMKTICRCLVAVGSGMNSKAEIIFETIEDRENAGVLLLQQATECIRTAHEYLVQNDVLSVSRSSRIVSNFLIPIFALFQMNAKLADLFGWGKRKRKTKRYSESVFLFASVLSSLVDALLKSCSSLTHRNLTERMDFMPCDSISQSSFDETVDVVVRSQLVSRQRITQLLGNIKEVLTTFDVE
jgi:N-terminal acetyltransferase B complex non-catalytic subunit